MDAEPIIKMWIDGQPKGKDRPRFNRKTGHVFPTDGNVNAEANIIAIWREQGSIGIPELGVGKVRIPIKLDILILVERPLSHFNKDGELNTEGLRHPQPENKKPDVDNAQKLIMDAMNKRAYKDDVKVVTSRQRRRWSRSHTGIHVTIQPETKTGDFD